MSAEGLVVDDQRGVARCGWAASTDDYMAYHDDEWGIVVHGESLLYERITLEAFQSGLSWLTILRKREGFRSAFAGFDADTVAAFGEPDFERLMADTSIVRNSLKIRAAITNAQAVVRLRAGGGLEELFWSFAPALHRRPRVPADIPATSAESVALAKALKHNGFVFVGPTTLYAAMQACGLVDDHLVGCYRASG
ncbi:MAG TPA: DNA-3-methyladenine glycosylase I [Dermatophilaceae bacterium]